MASYRGAKTTLCAGCGHNSISERIVECFYELGVEPWRVAKFSGIGCSSKSPAYFLNSAHGFNAVHGRMPSVATGAILANRNLLGIGVSGDGDTASIGVGQFIHLTRRNLPLIYIIENNGVYGLTKGQFSATADLGSRLRSGVENDLPPLHCCVLAVQCGASFVARSFSGDKKQLQAILKAAVAHKGLSVIDVISPCVTFNDHEGSTKSYAYVREHDEPLHELDFVPAYEEITVDIPAGAVREVKLHDGSTLRIRKLCQDYDPADKLAALSILSEAAKTGEVLTGVFYLETGKATLLDLLHLVDTPLAALPEAKVRPPKEALDEVMGELRRGPGNKDPSEHAGKN